MDGFNIAMAPPGKGTSIMDCTAKGNLNDGIEVVNNVIIRGNHCFNNLVAGIHVFGPGTGNRIEDNHVEMSPTGYLLDPPTLGNMVIKNTSSANGVPYAFPAGNHIGAIIAFPGPGFVGTSPWNNFTF
jgi:parallel beta-helix repeat protein